MFFNHSLHTNAESRTTVLIETVVRLSPTPLVPKHRNVNILAHTYGGGIFLNGILHCGFYLSSGLLQPQQVFYGINLAERFEREILVVHNHVILALLL